MNLQTLIQNFCLNIPVEYHAESLERLQKLEPDSLRQAAVLIGCVQRADGLHVILTKRASHLRHHPGQISFPGGKLEEDDISLQQAAIREAQEEIGLDPTLVTVLGELPPLMTFSRFMVTPVIALVEEHYQTTIDANEVESVFEVPADHLFNIDQLYSHVFRFKHYSHRIFAIPYKEHFIWGVTAQIIQALQLQLN